MFSSFSSGILVVEGWWRWKRGEEGKENLTFLN